MGKIVAPKHVELNWIYQQTVIVASSWLSSLPSLLMMHGQTRIKHANRFHLNDQCYDNKKYADITKEYACLTTVK
jgi:hypothetical protein